MAGENSSSKWGGADESLSDAIKELRLQPNNANRSSSPPVSVREIANHSRRQYHLQPFDYLEWRGAAGLLPTAPSSPSSVSQPFPRRSSAVPTASRSPPSGFQLYQGRPSLVEYPRSSAAAIGSDYNPPPPSCTQRIAEMITQALGDDTASLLFHVSPIIPSHNVFAMASDAGKFTALAALLHLDHPMPVANVCRSVCLHPHLFMVDPNASRVFRQLLSVCTENQVQDIAFASSRDRRSLVATATDRVGMVSLGRLMAVARKIAPLGLRRISQVLNGVDLQGELGRREVVDVDRLLNGSYEEEEFPFREVLERCVGLAVQRRGCTLLSNLFDRLPLRQTLLLVDKIVQSTLLLAYDPCGNYVIQRILDMELPDVNADVCARLRKHYVRLAMDKHGSHVVERCLQSSGRVHPLEELAGCQELDLLAKHKLGNYVVKTALKVAQGECRERMINALLPHLRSLLCDPSGANVCRVVKKLRRDLL